MIKDYLSHMFEARAGSAQKDEKAQKLLRGANAVTVSDDFSINEGGERKIYEDDISMDDEEARPQIVSSY